VYRTGVSDKAGKVSIPNLETGDYTLNISNVGYEKYTSETIRISEAQPSVTLSAKLKLATQGLNEVVVEARKPFIERKFDKLVVKIENSIVASGGTLLEALEKAPGVVTNQESSISLNGKQGLIVMIDGKPTPLSGADLIS
jgi:hypothetical protein